MIYESADRIDSDAAPTLKDKRTAENVLRCSLVRRTLLMAA